MIVFDLCCDNGHVFEGWFGSSDDFAEQKASGLMICPACGSDAVEKAPMAPSVGKKGSQLRVERPAASTAEAEPTDVPIAPVSNGEMPAEVKEAISKLADAQAKALKNSKWVGRKFAEESRKIHYGEGDAKAIHGEATREEAAELIDEGIAIAPLPLPVAPPDELN